MFFITGLPRSRTAWLAAFMTASGYPCKHEAMNNCKSIEEYKKEIKYCSDSNTAIGSIKLHSIYPERNVLVIHKDINMESFVKYGVDNYGALEKNLIEWADGVEKNLRTIDGLHINLSEIDERMPDIFKFLTGDEINNDIFNLFKQLSVESKEEMNRELALEFIEDAKAKGLTW